MQTRFISPGGWLRTLVQKSFALAGTWPGRAWLVLLLAPLLALVVVPLAYQAGRPVSVDLGTSYAAPYTSGFYDPQAGGGLTYSFTAARSALALPGIGRTPALLEVRVGGGVAGVVQTLYAGDRPVLRLAAGGEMTTYAVVLPADAARGGSLLLTWEGSTASPAGDPRQLGLAVDWVRWTPLRSVVGPDWGQVLAVALAALALGLLLHRLDFSLPAAAAGAGLLVLAVAVGLALARLALTVFTFRLAALLALLALLLPLLRRGMRSMLRRGGLELQPGIESWLWRVTILAALLKLGGVLYPQFIVLDVGPHTYRVFRFLSGDALSLFLPNSYSLLGQTVGVEGGQFPYSPLWHILSAPLTLLPWPLPLSMGLLNAMLDVSKGLLLFLLGARLTGRQQIGVWAAFFYTALPGPYYLLSWGNYPTQLGLWAALLAVTYLVVSYDRLGRGPALGRWVAVLLLAILSYTVDGVMTVVLLLLLVLLEQLFMADAHQRRRLAAILGGLVLAEVAAFVLYHAAFAGVLVRDTLPALLNATAAKATDLGQAQVDPRESLLSNWTANWTFVRNHVTDLGIVFALGGVVLLWAQPAWRRWRPLLAAWLLIFPLFGLFSGLVADMVLKHVLFLYPLLCLGMAALANVLWRKRAWAGRAVVALFGLWMGWWSVYRWMEYILIKRH